MNCGKVFLASNVSIKHLINNQERYGGMVKELGEALLHNLPMAPIAQSAMDSIPP